MGKQQEEQEQQGKEQPQDEVPSGSGAGCEYSGPVANSYVKDLATHGASSTFTSLDAAKAACDKLLACNAITEGRPQGHYTLRAASYTLPSPYNETSWLVTNASKTTCHALPRNPGINYSPGTLVRLTELSSSNGTKESYFSAVNSTAGTAAGTVVAVSAEKFYTELLAHAQHYATELLDPSKVMGVELPGAEGQRQADMALNALITTTSNFVGRMDCSQQ